MIACPNCMKPEPAAAKFLGRKVRCGKCGSRYRVPVTPDGMPTLLDEPDLKIVETAPAPALRPARAHPAARRALQRPEPEWKQKVGGLVSLFAVLAVCGGSAWFLWGRPVMNQREALRFNEALVAANKKLEAAGNALSDPLIKIVAGHDPATVPLRENIARAQQALQEVEADMKKIGVPDSASARALFAAYQDFLRGESQFAFTDLPAIATIAECRAMSLEDKRAKIIEVAQRMEASENAQLARLQSAQAAFAREFNIALARTS